MRQVNKTFDTVKVFRGIKTQLSEKLSNMNDAEVTGYLSAYNEAYYNHLFCFLNFLLFENPCGNLKSLLKPNTYCPSKGCMS